MLDTRESLLFVVFLFVDIAKSFIIKKDSIIMHILKTSYNVVWGFPLSSLDYIKVLQVSDPSCLKHKRTRPVVLEGKTTPKENGVVIKMKYTQHLNICISESHVPSSVKQGLIQLAINHSITIMRPIPSEFLTSNVYFN